MNKIAEIKETIREALEDMGEDNLLGVYNYIRYCNEDFGSDMIVNNVKPLSDNSQIQHYYLVCFMATSIEKYKIPDEFIQLYLANKEQYNDKLIEKEIQIIEKHM